MPLQLDTALDMGAVDTDYTHVRIMSFLHTGNYIQLVVQHGTMSGPDFIVGTNIPNITNKKFTIEGEDYTAIVATLTSAEAVPVYTEVSNALYQWLIDNDHYVGTIV